MTSTVTRKRSESYRRQWEQLNRKREQLKADGRPHEHFDPGIAALQSCELQCIREERAAAGKSIHGQGSLEI